jgi:hypothetical protein
MKTSHTVTVEAANDGTEDLVLPIPDEMMKDLGWLEGDELAFEPDDNIEKGFVIKNLSLDKRKNNTV